MSIIEGMKKYSVKEINKENLITLYISGYCTVLDSNMNPTEINKNKEIFNFRNSDLIKIGATDCWFSDAFPGCLKVVFNCKDDHDKFIFNIEMSLPKNFKITEVYKFGIKIKQIVEVRSKIQVL